MSIETQHRKYQQNSDIWQTCRDVFAGERAVKAAGTRYLPRVSERQKPEDYSAYLRRALFYNATARTVMGLEGFVFRKPPAVEFPSAIRDQLDDCTLSGVPFSAFAKSIFQEVLLVGRYGAIVDMPLEGDPNNRPYVTGYSAEQITNWGTTWRGGNKVLSWLVLLEAREELTSDPFERKFSDQYRLLELDSDGLYQGSIWQKEKDEKEYHVVEQYQPKRRGEPLDFIPFCFFAPDGIAPEVSKPPLMDLVDVNLSHYRSSADLEHSRHFCASPVYFFSGFDSEEVSPAIGSSQGIVSKNADARVSFVEFTGGGLQEQRLALTEKESMMAALGARLLEPTKRAAEAAETLQIRQSGESSALQSMAQSVGHGLTLLLRWWADWAGAMSGPAVCTLNTDFQDIPLSPQEMTALMALWQAGGISYATLHRNLEQGEITRPGISAEAEKHEIAAEGVL